MFKRHPPKTTRTVRIPERLHASVERIAATIDGARSGDVLELGFEVVQELLARIECRRTFAGSNVGKLSPSSPGLLVDHYSLVVAERVGARVAPEPHDGDPAVSDPETTRMFQ